ncbi:hybrid signal transduction histidine kinase E-like [Contarinia nasturtii]|uniref:hybrid signal transduction histidine kinase E-like n=1 Tax=Contarinia nasturtii TaxID=265458 RepID=UPI0012D3BB61|nr:hybrid signal transduction histidine kinase E-like [Contarinia nasturtii]
MTFNQTQYDQIKKTFNDIAKKIYNYKSRQIPSDPWKENTITEFLISFNNLKVYIKNNFKNLQQTDQTRFTDALLTYEDKFIARLAILGVTCENLPPPFDEIDQASIKSISKEEALNISHSHDIDFSDTENNSNPNTQPSGSNSDTSTVTNNSNSDTQPSGSSSTTPTVNHNSISNQQPQQITHNNMVMEKVAYMSLIAANIRHSYNGDPLKLQPFLASIDLMKEMAEENVSLLRVLTKFVLSKLEGYAAEVVPPNATSIDIIVDTLKDKIHPEGSKVVEGNMMALRVEKGNLLEYAKKAEELSNDLRRALVMEGIPLAKAEEVITEKTIELCRANTNNSVVRSILGGGHFKSPKEVIAKYIVETNTTKQEAQIFAMRKFSNNRNHNRHTNNKTNNYNNNNNRQQRQNNFQGHRSNGGNSNRNWNSNQNRNFGGNGNGNGQSNGYRGRGRGNQRGQQGVRVVENVGAAQRTLGEADNI